MISNSKYGFIDATFQTVPIIEYGYQFMTLMTDVCGKVSNYSAVKKVFIGSIAHYELLVLHGVKMY